MGSKTAKLFKADLSLSIRMPRSNPFVAGCSGLKDVTGFLQAHLGRFARPGTGLLFQGRNRKG